MLNCWKINKDKSYSTYVIIFQLTPIIADIEIGKNPQAEKLTD